METITFANGETHNCTFFASIPNEAYVAIDDVSFAEAAAIFSNPEKTVRMTYGSRVFTGFTTLIAVAVQPYGTQAVLRGGTETTIESEGNNGRAD
jgi:hypothetical protein